MPPIVILESNPISGVGAVTFTLQNQPAENNLILVIVCGSGNYYGSVYTASPFESVGSVYNDLYGIRGIVACRYDISQGMTITAYNDTGTGSNHWIGYYYVIQVEGTTVAGAFDTSANIVDNAPYLQSPYFPYHYNPNVYNATSGPYYYTYPSITPSENTALLIVPWQTPEMDDPAPACTGIVDPFNNANIWTLDCSLISINPNEQGQTSAQDGSYADPDGYDDVLYVGHLNINNQTPISYTPQLQFPSTGGPVNNLVKTLSILYYSLLSSNVLVIKNDSATPPPSGPSTYAVSETDTLPTFSDGVSGTYIAYVNPTTPCTYSIQGFILPDSNIPYKPVLVVIGDDTLTAEFKQTLNYSPLNQ